MLLIEKQLGITFDNADLILYFLILKANVIYRKSIRNKFG